MEITNIKDITKDNYLLFSAIRGSHVFGLATETSDLDTVGLFCSPIEWRLGPLDYQDIFLSEKNDDVIYELDKFIFGLGKSNPNYLEALFTPEKWITYFNPIIQPLWDIRDQLLTKSCYYSFFNYGLSQISKAKGLKKKINIDPKRVERRKTPLEFCVVPKKDIDGSLNLLDWLARNNLDPKYCGATRLAGGIQFFSLYYDYAADKSMTLENFARLKYNAVTQEDINVHKEEWQRDRESKFIKYRGLLDPNCEDTSQIRCSEISKADSKYPLIAFQFNENAFKDHCTEYREYWDWVAKRNPDRFNLNQGYNYDSKNMSACVRLLKLGIEILRGEGMKLDRTNIDREFLLDIKLHKLTYDEVMKVVNQLKSDIEIAREQSTLPDQPDLRLLNDLQIKIRKSFYNI